MKYRILLATFAVALIGSATSALAADVISDVMKKYHKAPKGTDPLCKKASNGDATPSELSDLLKGYQDIAKVEPPKGTKESWEAKTKALITGVEVMQKDAKNTAAFKAAVNCKACHTDHKPD